MTYDIRLVAIYLRKSRGDEEKDLQKHRNTLVELCTKNQWKYIEYAEIGTSDSIEMRPIFMKLLNDIKADIYDAIVVMDYDRLSRGSKSEQGNIEDIIKNSNTLIITPNKVYDLNNDLDATYSDFQGLFARFEYKTITRRLKQGKIAGSKMGNWTNGIPTFPYEYQKWNDKFNEKGLVVNDDKLEIYRFIIEQALKGITPQDISVDLNKKCILSPREKTWSNVTVYRLLIDETHLGKIITNKTQGDGHKIKKSNAKKIKEIPKSEWNIVDNCHQAVKTQLEHDRILELIKSRQIIPVRARAGTYELSGLIKCGICGYGMTFQKKNNEYILIKPCWHITAIGEKCNNRGGSYDELLKIIKDDVNEYIHKCIKILKNNDNNNYDDKINALRVDINKKKKDCVKYANALGKVNDSYELGDYTRDEWLIRKGKWENLIYSTKNEIDSLERKIISLQNVNPTDRIDYYNDLFNRLDAIDIIDLNNVYKDIINAVKWTREGEEAQINIEYN